MFIDRKKELNLLENVADAFKAGRKIPIAIMGLRRIGKTELIMKFREEKRRGMFMPYLNLQGSVSSPETFSQDFYIALLEELVEIKPMGSKRDAIIALSSAIGEDVYNVSMGFLSTLDAGDYNEMIKTCFRMPELIADKLGVKIIFFLDEFQDIQELNNYRFGDVIKIMRSVVEKQRSTLYVLSGSVISFMEKLVKDSTEPFFNQFTILSLPHFTKDDSIVLIKRLLRNRKIKQRSVLNIFRCTAGHPFYITAICERIALESLEMESLEVIDDNLVNYAIIRETIDKNGKINILFMYIFEESLKKTKKKGHMQNILKYLAEEEGANLTKISQNLRKPTGQVSNYIKSLLKTDLVFERGKRYFYRDPLFRFWVAKTQLGKDIEIKRTKRSVEEYLEDLREKYLKVSTELGIAKEYELKYGLEEELGIKLKNYLKDDIELDLVGKKNGTCYIIEIKWRNRPADYKDLKKFLEKIKKSEFANRKKRLIFISKSGFTAEAKSLAEKNKIELKD